MSTLTTKSGEPFNKALLESLLKRRMFFTPSFEIYRSFESCRGATRGIYDYGPPGCSLQANIVDLWRKHFVLEERMLEVDCTILTPAEVFKTSGHVDKFTDWMCKDPTNGDFLRADHLVESVLETRLQGDKAARGLKFKQTDGKADAKKAEKKVKDIKAVQLDDAVVSEYEEILAKIDNYNGAELAELIKKHDIRNPETKSEVMPPVSFNLMFQTTIGPSSTSPGYLRPETAQGQFLNFKKLLDFNQNVMPFASASIGKSFRNEISPRSGLLRVREFLMAEIEHFVDPESKQHPKFADIQNIELALLDRTTQLAGKTEVKRMSIGDAVKSHTIDNETLGFFLARIQIFLEKLGIDQTKLRFRQHMANEMAHYAADCWDAELYTSYGWIECVGCADRSAYDLTVHSNKTQEALIVREPRPQPLRIDEWQVDIQRKKLGPKFRKDAKIVEDAVEALSQLDRGALAKKLSSEGSISIEVPGLNEPAILDKSMIDIVKRTRISNTRAYTPNVIEPSFGIGRILYCLIEHVYWHRPEDEARGVLSFPPVVAPTKVLIVPLSNQPAFKPFLQRISTRLTGLSISHDIDNSTASIGKRYARNDELGTPLGITVDFDTLKDETVTLRDRDTTKQVRASETKILDAVTDLVNSKASWSEIFKRLPEFTGQSGEN